MSNSKFVELIAQLNAHKGFASDDLQALFKEKSVFFFDEKVMTYGEEMGAQWDAIFELPQKQIKRTVQFISALQRADYKNIDATHARILCAMRLAGEYNLTTDAIVALAANKRSDKVNVRGIGYSALNKLFAKSHGVSTVKAKVSNSTGKRGFYQSLGITFAAPGQQNHEIMMNPDSPMVKRFFELLDRATIGQLEELTGEK